MDQDAIHVELIISRRYRGMPPIAQRAYTLLREALRIAVIAGVAWILFQNLRAGAAAGLTVGLIWVLADRWTRHSLGTSRILLTDDGIYVMKGGLYCDWEDVTSHDIVGNTVVFSVGGEAAASGLWPRRRGEVPFGTNSRAQVMKMFKEKAARATD